jgi:hypothetical protein
LRRGEAAFDGGEADAIGNGECVGVTFDGRAVVVTDTFSDEAVLIDAATLRVKGRIHGGRGQAGEAAHPGSSQSNAVIASSACGSLRGHGSRDNSFTQIRRRCVMRSRLLGVVSAALFIVGCGDSGSGAAVDTATQGELFEAALPRIVAEANPFDPGCCGPPRLW